jgi:hypothetical protein
LRWHGHETSDDAREAAAAGDGAHDAEEYAGHYWRGRDENDLAALAAHSQDPVAVFLADVVDARAAGFEDPQSERAEHGDEREVVRVVQLPGGSDQHLELQMAQPEGG